MGPTGAVGAPGSRGSTGDIGPEVRNEMYFMYVMRWDLHAEPA